MRYISEINPLLRTSALDKVAHKLGTQKQDYSKICAVIPEKAALSTVSLNLSCGLHSLRAPHQRSHGATLSLGSLAGCGFQLGRGGGAQQGVSDRVPVV